MLGNGNYSIPSFAIFIFGALLLPDLWTTFYKDYINGRNSKPIICNNIGFRASIFRPNAKPENVSGNRSITLQQTFKF